MQVLTVSSPFVLAGGAAEQAGTIEAGDEILAINGKPLVGLVHFDAWNIMKSVPEGPVQLVIRKHRNPWVLARIPSPRLTSFSKSGWLLLRTDGLWNQYTADTDIHDCSLHKPGPLRLGSVISFSACPCLPPSPPPHTHTFAVDQELICSSRTPSYTFASFLPPLPAAVLVSGDQKGNTNAPAKMMYVCRFI